MIDIHFVSNSEQYQLLLSGCPEAKIEQEGGYQRMSDRIEGRGTYSDISPANLRVVAVTHPFTSLRSALFVSGMEQTTNGWEDGRLICVLASQKGREARARNGMMFGGLVKLVGWSNNNSIIAC